MSSVDNMLNDRQFSSNVLDDKGMLCTSVSKDQTLKVGESMFINLKHILNVISITPVIVGKKSIIYFSYAIFLD